MSVFYDHSLVFSRWDPRACVAQFTSGRVLKFSLFRSLNLIRLRCSPILSHCIRTLNSNQIHLILAFFCSFASQICLHWMNESNTKKNCFWWCVANGMALICEHVLFMKFAFVAFRICVSFLFSFSLVLIKQIRHSWHRTKKKIERMLECCVQLLVPVNYQP